MTNRKFSAEEIEWMRETMQDRVVVRVSEATGIEYFTLLRFVNGTHISRDASLVKLWAYLKGEANE